MRRERKWKGFVGVERAAEETEGIITMEKSGVKPLHRGDTAVLQAIESLEKRGFSNIKFNDIFRAGKRFGIMSEDEVYMRREIGEPRSENLSEAEFAVLETIYELKNKRRMSTILINDVLRRGQTKHKGIREEGYLRWVIPGYELTRKGIEVLNV